MKGGEKVISTADSILDTVKTSVNIDPMDSSFDQEILLSINMSIFKLAQLGINVNVEQEVTDRTTKWVDKFSNNTKELSAIKTYLRINARLEFDPPSSSFAITALNEQKRETEWRLHTQV